LCATISRWLRVSQDSGALEGAGGVTLPLAYGELSVGDALELAALKELIEKRAGVRCGQYKEKCLRRRIAVRMRARGVHTYGDYARLLDSEEEESRRLVDTITINVSKFFRNREVWEIVREAVVPALFAVPDDVVRIWSAGSASGEEAYSMAMMLLEHAERTGQPPTRFRIVGTDIDAASLTAARMAEYGAFAFSETLPEEKSRWFEWDRAWRVRPAVQSLVTFERHDLMRDPFPAGQRLIFCRNVIIYFERSAQELLLERLHDALVPGGFLVLGKVETLLGRAVPGFRAISARDRVFERV
jgi:chemotaxis protein methyltransferase CheR